MPSKKCDPECECAKHRPRSAEVRKRISSSLKGRNIGIANGVPTDGRSVTKEGYVMLSGQYGHPLAGPGKRGEVLEHRKVLYDLIGPGPHPCHWCGRSLEWGGVRGINVDHLNDVKDDNRPENLVPSCLNCNGRRGKPPKQAKYIPGTPEYRQRNTEQSRLRRARLRGVRVNT